MPELYIYLGISIFFYSNDHEPIHVHGRHQGKESKADITFINGKPTVTISNVKGKSPLEGKVLKDFELFVKKRAVDIAEKWTAFFVLNKKLKPEIITAKLK